MQRSWTRWLWLLPLLLAFAWAQGNGYEGLSEQDSHDYFRVAKAWRAWFQGGLLPEATEHPQAYPALGAVLSLVIGDVLWALRLITLLSFVLLGWSVRSILQRAHPAAVGSNAFMVLAIGASPFLLRHSLVVMSDLPAIALVVFAYSQVLRVSMDTVGRSTVSIPLLLLVVLAGGLAIAVRSASTPVVIVLAVFPVLSLLKPRARVAAIVLLIALAALAYLVVPTGTWKGSPIADWSPLNLFRRELRSDDGVFTYRFPNLIYVCSAVVHPGLLPIGVLLLPFVRRVDLRAVHAQLALCVAATYLLFIAGMPFQNDRVLLMAQPFIAILLFPEFSRAWVWAAAKSPLWPKWMFAGIVVVQMGLFARAMRPFIQRARTERAIAHAVGQLHPTLVYTHGMGGAIASYCTVPNVVELWYTAIDTFTPGALVVIRPGGLDEQWRGLSPAINWQRIQRHGVEHLAALPEGWKLYRLR
jgi:hypothetical protein